jgi:hypothetical protein
MVGNGSRGQCLAASGMGVLGTVSQQVGIKWQSLAELDRQLQGHNDTETVIIMWSSLAASGSVNTRKEVTLHGIVSAGFCSNSGIILQQFFHIVWQYCHW